MHLSALLLALFVGAVHVFSAPAQEQCDALIHLSPEASARLGELIVEDDDPDALADVLGDHRVSWTEVDDLVSLTARRNRFRSMEFLLSRVNFVGRQTNRLAAILFDALVAHKPEICDVLLAQDFEPSYLAIVFNFRQSFWTGTSFGHSVPFLWTLNELVYLVTSHPRLTRLIEPRAWEHCPDVQRFMLMLDILPHMAALDQEIANSERVHPTYILHQVVRNENLNGEDMRLVLDRLLQMDAVLDAEIFTEFRHAHAEDHLNVQYLQEVLNGPDVKEPGVE